MLDAILLNTEKNKEYVRQRVIAQLKSISGKKAGKPFVGTVFIFDEEKDLELVNAIVDSIFEGKVEEEE